MSVQSPGKVGEQEQPSLLSSLPLRRDREQIIRATNVTPCRRSRRSDQGL